MNSLKTVTIDVHDYGRINWRYIRHSNLAENIGEGVGENDNEHRSKQLLQEVAKAKRRLKKHSAVKNLREIRPGI